MKKTFVLSLKIVLLTILYFVLFAAGNALLGPDLPSDPSMASAALAGSLFVSLVDTLVLTLVITRSHWSGLKLIATTCVSYYGVMTFMSQIETAYFGPSLGIKPEWLPHLFAATVPVVLIFIPIAVWVLGKARSSQAEDAGVGRLAIPAVEWVWKLAVIGAMYVALYFTFGFFVAWQNPNLVAMYGNGSNAQVFNNAVLVPFQFLRGVLWALFALPLIRSAKGNAWQVGLLVGLLLAIPMNIVHFIPNPIMPDASVRMSHFIETASSNFIFGFLLTQLILWNPARKPARNPEIGAPKPA